jgi:hypothetical protein
MWAFILIAFALDEGLRWRRCRLPDHWSDAANCVGSSAVRNVQAGHILFSTKYRCVQFRAFEPI